MVDPTIMLDDKSIFVLDPLDDEDSMYSARFQKTAARMDAAWQSL